MSWKNNYKRKRQKRNLFNRFYLMNFKKIINNYSRILLWGFVLLIFYSVIQYNFLNSSEKNNSRKWNEEQIKKLNLEELYKTKDINHSEVDIWILNNTKQTGLAARIRDCLEKGYNYNQNKVQGDYNVYKQDNFDDKHRTDLGYISELETKIFVHVDTIDNPDFKIQVKDFLSFTGYNHKMVTYHFEKRLQEERDITIILGDDWNESGKLVNCENIIN